MANYPTLIESSAVASNGTFAYSAGGFANEIGATGATYRYDPVANTWTPLASMQTPAYDAAVAYAANVNKVFVFGGDNDTSGVLNTTQIYDIASNTWTMGAAMPDFRIWARAAYYSANGKIYVIGGYDSGFNETSQVWEYDPVANTWDTSRAPDPVTQGGSGLSIVGQYIYVAGGGFGSSNAHNRYDIVG